MSAETGSTLWLGEREVRRAPEESVLEALERAGVDVVSGCRAGVCAKCLQRTDDEVPAGSQRGLRPSLAAAGYFLACQARPTKDLRIADSSPPDPVDARLESLEIVAPDVARLFVVAAEPFDYRPGQYLDVLHPSGAARSYSIASLPSRGAFELHVRRVPDGLVSEWLHGLEAGAELRIRGAFGQCYFVPDEEEAGGIAGASRRKLLLVGAGTGLAPLLGIARDALDRGHAGPIDLVHGALEPSRLYLREELEALASEWPQFRVHHCVLRNATAREHEGSLDEVAIRLAGPLGGARAFLCGDDEIVRRLQRSLFLAGLPSREIYADPFVSSGSSGVSSGVAASSV